jgi:predicted ATPase
MKGLDLLATLPESLARLQQELDFRMTLGSALTSIKGNAAPEVEQAYARARAICQQVGESPQLFPVLWGLWRVYYNRGALQTAREMGEQLLSLTERQHDPSLLEIAHVTLGATLNMLGEFANAHTHLEQGLALYTPEAQRTLVVRYGMAPGVHGRAFSAQNLWSLGYPDQALYRSHEALALAQELAHPYMMAFALYHVARLHLLRRETATVSEHAVTLMTLASEQRFALWVGVSLFLQGWVRIEQGQGEAGVTQMRQGLTDVLATGGFGAVPYYRILLAEAYGNVEQSNEGLRVLAEAMASGDESETRQHEAERYRLKGALLLRQPTLDTSQVEACFHHALDIARSQQAKSLELRAATSLARLWRSQGKRQDAYDLLAPVYGWFTEGFDTADLKDARALLDGLGG